MLGKVLGPTDRTTENKGLPKVRVEANDDELRAAAIANAQAIGAGHVFVVLLRQAYPVNVLGRIKECFEVCSIYCATANPVEVIVAESPQAPQRIPAQNRLQAPTRKPPQRHKGRNGCPDGTAEEVKVSAFYPRGRRLRTDC